MFSVMVQIMNKKSAHLPCARVCSLRAVWSGRVETDGVPDWDEIRYGILPISTEEYSTIAKKTDFSADGWIQTFQTDDRAKYLQTISEPKKNRCVEGECPHRHTVKEKKEGAGNAEYKRGSFVQRVAFWVANEKARVMIIYCICCIVAWTAKHILFRSYLVKIHNPLGHHHHRHSSEDISSEEFFVQVSNDNNKQNKH